VAAWVDEVAVHERPNALPCRITYYGTAPEAHYGPFYGAPVVSGDAVSVLLSDGRVVAL
jgi:hypothetical protein